MQPAASLNRSASEPIFGFLQVGFAPKSPRRHPAQDDIGKPIAFLGRKFAMGAGFCIVLRNAPSQPVELT